MWLVKFLGCATLLNLYHAVHVVPQVIRTQTGGSYTILMKDEKISPVQCIVEDGESEYELDLKTTGVPAIPITSKAAASDVITSLGDGICGFKLDNVTIPLVRWSISFTDDAKNVYYESAKAYVRDLAPRNTKIFASVGDEIFIPCFLYETDEINWHYCELHDPCGKPVTMGTNNCQYSKPVTTIADFGMWTCMINTEVSMGTTVLEYEVIKQEQDIINIWKNETDTHVNIGCSITTPRKYGQLDMCLMVRSDGEKFALIPGKATQRYTSVKTDLENHICNMQILKPLDETEENLWRCEMHSYRNAIGGFIDLSTSKSSNKADQVYTPKTVIVLKDNELSIRCRVPYSSPYCYIIDAKGLRYPVEDERSPTLGLCEFSKNSTLSDKGIWYCGFAMSNGEPDKVYPFTVSVLRQLTVKPEKETVSSELSSSAQLMCTTNGFGGEPLKYCLFRSPKGDSYFINDKQTTNRISYSGRGLEFGDCGILIRDVRIEDKGTWSCITRIGNDFKNKEISSDIRLFVD